MEACIELRVTFSYTQVYRNAIRSHRRPEKDSILGVKEVTYITNLISAKRPVKEQKNKPDEYQYYRPCWRNKLNLRGVYFMENLQVIF
jgi:hypothetical protein